MIWTLGSQALGIQCDDWSGRPPHRSQTVVEEQLLQTFSVLEPGRSPGMQGPLRPVPQGRLRSDTHVESCLKASCSLNQDTTGKTLEEGQ